jgi:peptidoglycan-associated lipoprotein
LQLSCFWVFYNHNSGKTSERSLEEHSMGPSSKSKIILSMALLGLVISGCASTTDGRLQNSSAPQSAATTSSLNEDAQNLVANVADRVFFATDQSNIDGSSRATLRDQAAWLNQNASIRLTIEGHADERGTREYNLALGARRANAVRDFLISEGVSGDRLQTISYGKERPVSLCSEESCWSKNRRAVANIR